MSIAKKHVVLFSVLVLASGCGGGGEVVAGTTGPGDPPSSATDTQLTSGPHLVQCPTSTAASTQATIGPLGGLLSLGGTSVSIPLGALLEPVTISLTIPASQYMEIDVSVAGTDHFVFEQPIVVTLDYSRCSRSNIDLAPLTVWHIDEDSKALLEAMPTVDNKLTRQAIFTTGHLSGYALAN
jgi:hypothetical protein